MYLIKSCRKHSRKLNSKAFTLTEILITIGILGIMLVIGLHSMGGTNEVFKRRADDSTALEICREIEVFYLARELTAEEECHHNINYSTKLLQTYKTSNVKDLIHLDLSPISEADSFISQTTGNKVDVSAYITPIGEVVVSFYSVSDADNNSQIIYSKSFAISSTGIKNLN